MAKLIYINKSLADSKTWLGSNWDTDSNDYYRGIVFTSDGHIITHGKVFIGLNNTYQLTLNGTTNGSGTSLGSFYAPTSAGSNHQILQSSGSGAPSWASLVTSLSSSEDYTIPTSYAVKEAISNAIGTLSGALQYRGTSTTDPKESGATVAGYTDWKIGDVVAYNSKEYVLEGSTNVSTNWRELGDESSFLLKTAKPVNSTTLSISDTTIGSSEGITINLSSITVTNNKGTNNVVSGLTVDSYGRVTAVTYGLALSNASASVASNVTGVYTIGTITKGDGSILTLYGHDVNTWRPVYAYTLNSNLLSERLNSNTGTNVLLFGSEFAYTEGDTGGQSNIAEIHLAWAEVDANGNITYAI